MIDLAKLLSRHWPVPSRRKLARLRLERWGRVAWSSGCGLALLCAAFSVATAQAPPSDDPFAAAPDSLQATPGQTPGTDLSGITRPSVGTGSPSVPAAAEETDPVIKLLRSIPPKTPSEFAEALKWMVQIQRWDEIGRYLDMVQEAGWSRDQLAELARAGGTGLWLSLRSSDNQLTAAQLKFIDELAVLPTQLARDPAWIDGWINKLASDSVVDRREAQMRLEQAHRAAIERLCARLLSGDAVPSVRLVESLLEFQADGIEALRAACVSSDAGARGRVLLALARSSARDFGVELGSGLYSRRLPEQARLAISDALMRKYGKLPTAQAVHEFIVSRFERQLDDYQLARSRSRQVPVKVWRAGSDGFSVTAINAIAPDRSLELLAQIAAHRIVHSIRLPEDLIDSLTVLLQHSYQSRPGVESEDPTGQVLMGLPAEAEGSDLWKQVLDRSQNWQMHGASIRAAQAIGRDLVNATPGSPSFDFIAACLRDSRPVMRYIAVDAIARSNIREPYNGAGNALETAIEMSRLGQGPMVLVIGLTAELREIAAQQLQALGAPSISVNSTQAALQILDQPYPIEMIMIVDRVPRNSLLELVERLRHSRRGGALPIAVLTDDLRSFEATELPRYPGVAMSVLSREPDHMPRIISELERHLDVRPLTEAERAEFVATANSLLATIAADRQQYSFYPLARWEKELTSATESMPTDAWLTILGGLGTSEGQERLAMIAADQSSAEETRNQAAAVFARSVKQFGLLLSRSAQLKSYDLYNTQGPNDPVTVSALGQVLDAIETRTGTLESAPAP